MYKYVISKWADPIVAVGVGLASFKYYEAKQSGPTLMQLLQRKLEENSLVRA